MSRCPCSCHHDGNTAKLWHVVPDGVSLSGSYIVPRGDECPWCEILKVKEKRKK